MTSEEKQLLLKDLCGRLPYGVIVKDRNATHELSTGNTEFVDLFNGKCHIKPYLRPMSSMTEEEKEELEHEHSNDRELYMECFARLEKGDTSMQGKVILHYAADYCNAHHFDYRGLIEKGLALEATEDMYKIE